MDASELNLIYSKSCRELKDNFCHSCAGFILDSVLSKCIFTKTLKDRYKDLFGFSPRFLDLDSTGQSICEKCQWSWREQIKVKELVGASFRPKQSATIWHPPKRDHSDCRIHLTKLHKYNKKASLRDYPVSSSVKLPVLNQQYQTVIIPAYKEELRRKHFQKENAIDFTLVSTSTPAASPECTPIKRRSTRLLDSSFHLNSSPKRKSPQKLFDEDLLNDFFRKHTTNLTSSSIMASQFKDMGLTTPDVRIGSVKTRSAGVKAKLFAKATVSYTIERRIPKKATKAASSNKLPKSTTETETREIVYCCDINGLFNYFGKPHEPQGYRLSMDGSKSSLKAALLKNKDNPDDQDEPPIVILYSEKCKENRTTMEKALELLNYKEFLWPICGKNCEN